MRGFFVIQSIPYSGLCGLANGLHVGRVGLGKRGAQRQPRINYESKEKITKRTSDNVEIWVGGDASVGMVYIGQGGGLVDALRQILKLFIRIPRISDTSTPSRVDNWQLYASGSRGRRCTRAHRTTFGSR